jgi:hypothetical protein
MLKSQAGRYRCHDHSSSAPLEEGNPRHPHRHGSPWSPLGTGLVDSLSRPSENITGMSLMVPEMAVKRLELLREVVPGISRVLVLSFLADPIAPIQVKAMEGGAGSLGLVLQVQDIRAADDIPAAYETGSRAGAEGVLVTEESMFIVHRARLTEFVARYKLPAVYPFLLPVTDAGGLMAYAVHAPELYRNAAVYVDRILKVAKVTELPVQQPSPRRPARAASAAAAPASPRLLDRRKGHKRRRGPEWVLKTLDKRAGPAVAASRVRYRGLSVVISAPC